MHACDRHLGSAYEIELVLGQGVGLVAAAWELAVADEVKLLRHGRDAERRESLAAGAVERELEQRELQQRRVTFENIAARAGYLDAALEIEHVQPAHQADVVERLEAELRWRAPALGLDIVFLALAFRHGHIRDVGYEQPERAQPCLQLALARLQLFERTRHSSASSASTSTSALRRRATLLMRSGCSRMKARSSMWLLRTFGTRHNMSATRRKGRTALVSVVPPLFTAAPAQAGRAAASLSR